MISKEQQEQLDIVSKLLDEWNKAIYVFRDTAQHGTYEEMQDCLLEASDLLEDCLETVNAAINSVEKVYSEKQGQPLNERIAVLEERLNNHINVKSPWNVKIETAINDILVAAEMETREFAND